MSHGLRRCRLEAATAALAETSGRSRIEDAKCDRVVKRRRRAEELHGQGTCYPDKVLIGGKPARHLDRRRLRGPNLTEAYVVGILLGHEFGLFKIIYLTTKRL